MWLFILAVLLVLLYTQRGYLKSVAKTMKMRGIIVPGLSAFEKQYPTYTRRVKIHLAKFNDMYQKTFDFKNASACTLNKLFSIRDDVLYNISEIQLRLPNDLNMEKAITRVHDTADRRMMEYITDAKSRIQINIYPGQTSSAFAARSYRASNDIVA
jgi:hypothetical protein